MIRYRVENCHTGQSETVTMTPPEGGKFRGPLSTEEGRRKYAHEIACCLWPGVPVEVTSEAEYEDCQEFIRLKGPLTSCLDAAYHALPDSNYQEVMEFLNEAETRLGYLVAHFEKLHLESLSKESYTPEPEDDLSTVS